MLSAGPVAALLGPLLFFLSLAACKAAASPEMGSQLSDLWKEGAGGGGGGDAPPPTGWVMGGAGGAAGTAGA